MPAAPIAGLLHPWLDGATAFCWARLADLKEPGPYDAMAVPAFLSHVPDRERGLAEFERLRDTLLGTVTYDLSAPGHVHLPLDFASRPSPLPPFPQDLLDAHLDALLAAQPEEGGRRANWPMWTPLVGHEWGGHITVQRLRTLQAYGRPADLP
ncbi:hypothetical protein [Nonomuraea sp. NPDC049309]|uniref:hypothetical protein n=1 Tax=Nonomuraea sp. NPDC049309 TaxID=3364350 RepID=UPI0037135662